MTRKRQAVDRSRIDWSAARNLASIMQPTPESQRLIHIQQGDSMAPEIPPGTIVIVDTSITWWVKEGFYLLNLPGKAGTAFPPSQQIFHIMDRGISREHEGHHWMAYPNPHYEGYWALAENLDIAGLVVGSIRCLRH